MEKEYKHMTHLTFNSRFIIAMSIVRSQTMQNNRFRDHVRNYIEIVGDFYLKRRIDMFIGKSTNFAIM